MHQPNGQVENRHRGAEPDSHIRLPELHFFDQALKLISSFLPTQLNTIEMTTDGPFQHFNKELIQ
jgi:hypothetical protein